MRKPVIEVSLLTTALCVVLSGCSLTRPEEDPVQIKLADIETRLARAERVVANQSLLDLAQRNDALQTETRTLRGRVEELENSLEAMRKQQRDLYADLERRMSQLGTAGMGGSSMMTGGGNSVGYPSAGSSAVVAGASAAEQSAYTQAFNALKAANYPVAIAGFREFLASFPNAQLASNAQYWLGEAYYITRDFVNATTAFRNVVDHWPTSAKAPDALLKLGYTQQELQRRAEARATLTEVTTRFPNSEAARLATERLRQLPPNAP